MMTQIDPLQPAVSGGKLAYKSSSTSTRPIYLRRPVRMAASTPANAAMPNGMIVTNARFSIGDWTVANDGSEGRYLTAITCPTSERHSVSDSSYCCDATMYLKKHVAWLCGSVRVIVAFVC